MSGKLILAYDLERDREDDEATKAYENRLSEIANA